MGCVERLVSHNIKQAHVSHTEKTGQLFFLAASHVDRRLNAIADDFTLKDQCLLVFEHATETLPHRDVLGRGRQAGRWSHRSGSTLDARPIEKRPPVSSCWELSSEGPKLCPLSQAGVRNDTSKTRDKVDAI